MEKSKTKEEARRELAYMDEQLRGELKEKIHEFGLDCSRRFCRMGYSWIDDILIYFLDLKIKFEARDIIRKTLRKKTKKEKNKR